MKKGPHKLKQSAYSENDTVLLTHKKSTNLQSNDMSEAYRRNGVLALSSHCALCVGGVISENKKQPRTTKKERIERDRERESVYFFFLFTTDE